MKRMWRRPKALVFFMSLASMLTPAALIAPRHAAAQGFYPSPYGDYPPRPIFEPEPEPEVAFSRRDVAAILARHGYRLVGPLRDRGDRVVASGVDALGRMAKFVVDPDEGEIVRSWPVGPAFGPGGPHGEFAAPGPYEPAEEGDLGRAGPPERRFHARRDEGEAPDRYARGHRTRHATLAMHPRRVLQHTSLSQPRKVAPPVTAAAAHPAPPPGRAGGVTEPPAKTSTSPAPIQTTSAPPSSARGAARASAPNPSSSKSAAEQPPSVGIENEAVPKSNIGR